jgi:hypothetical protein
MLKTIFIRSDPMSGDLGEDAAGDPERRRAERLADGEADEARPGVVARDEQQDAQHHEQLDADEHHAPRSSPTAAEWRKSDTASPSGRRTPRAKLAKVFTRMPNQATP